MKSKCAQLFTDAIFVEMQSPNPCPSGINVIQLSLGGKWYRGWVADTHCKQNFEALEISNKCLTFYPIFTLFL